ncbi:phosphopantetheine-binding protein [Nonomuraea sp. NPDC005650]|uniref:phosphopantetheine-binding protein n=1 Tax=Nonomuraea sp. NPDC005650 TaxID=3157045 RepID=UPI0033BA1B3F
MSDEEILAAVRDRCVSILKVDPNQVTLDARLREDLEADSLDLAELHIAMEDTWGPMPRETLAGVHTIADVLTRARLLVGTSI